MKIDELEAALKSQRWREPPAGFMQRTLEEAMRERGRPHNASAAQKRPGLLMLIPRPMRLPVAACWLLALVFRIATPEPIPMAAQENGRPREPMTPAQLHAHFEQVERLAYELTQHRDRPASSQPPF